LAAFPKLGIKGVPNILEVGCGTGMNLFELSRDATLIGEGYDLNADYIQIATDIRDRLGLRGLIFYCQDAAEMAPEKRFDAILMIDVLEHLENPASVVKRLDPFLSEGGYLLVSVPTP
jgi:2-polyprenyl-3-methyl-5-hydroxy-6-metoxy-1,4-benzoquinol methylase